VGAFFSLVMIFTVLGYATNKLAIMIARTDYTIKTELIEGFYPPDYVFETNPNRFPFAFGVADASGKPLKDFSEYGELRAMYLAFDGLGFAITDIPIRECELKDFRLGEQADPNSIRFQPADNTKKMLLKGSIRPVCIDENVRITLKKQGKGTALGLAFLPCNPLMREVCKSPEEIEAWITGKNLFMLTNNSSFTSSEFGQKAFNEETYYNFMFMRAEEASMSIYEITKSQVIQNDDYILGRSSAYFSASVKMIRSEKLTTLPRYSNIMAFIVSRNLQITSRTVYSFTDWMNEVGGFHAWIHLFISLVLPFC
jgi:hypothetical protein